MKVEEVISEIFAEQFHMEEPSHSIFLSALDAAGYAVVPKEPTTGAQYTYGHCKEKQQPNGCQRHNCLYPYCDRRSAMIEAAKEE